MQKRKKTNNWLTVIVLFLVGAVALTAFLVARPLLKKNETIGGGISDLQGSESEQYGRRLLYEAVTRDRMQEIVIHNKDHEYVFKRPVLADPTYAFQFYVDGVLCDGVLLDDEKTASLVVSVGTTYVQERLIDSEALASANEAEREEIYAKYGLDMASDPSYFELTRFTKTLENGKEKITTDTYRVYVGSRTVSGDNYYLRYADSDAVYVSNSYTVGNIVNADPAYYANLLIHKESYSQAAYLIKDVMLYHRLNEKNAEATVGDGHVVTLLAAVMREGETPIYEPYTINVGKSEAFAEALRGKTLGACDLTVQVPRGHDQLTTYHVKEILAIDVLGLQYTYLDEGSRDKFDSGVVHRFDASSSLAPYTVNSNSCMDVSECLQALTAQEIVDIGVTQEKLEAYGLYAHRLSFEMPMGGYVTTASGGTQFAIVGYVPYTLYFSDILTDGTRYVACVKYKESAEYETGTCNDVIGKIDAETVFFLEEDDFHWVSSYMLSVNILDVASLSFAFDYADLKETYTFGVRTQTTEKNGEVSETLRDVTYLEGDRLVDLSAFVQIYSSLVYLTYLAPYDGEASTEEVMADEHAHLLSLTVTLDDGRSRTYDFYAYSERHALVAVDGSAHFYVQTPKVKKLASDIALMLDGGMPDYEKLH